MPKLKPMTVTVAAAPAGGQGDTLVVTIGGDMGINELVGPTGQPNNATSNPFEQAMAQRQGNPPAMVVVDLTEVTYMASAGMGALLRLKKQVESTGAKMRFVGTDGLRTLLRHSHLHTVLKLHPTVDLAMAAD